MSAPTDNESERLLDLARGLYALLEPEMPTESAITAARWLAGEAVAAAKGIVEHERAALRGATS